MSGSSACWFSRAASVTAFAPCAEQCHPWFWVYGYRQVTGSDQASLCGEEQVEVHLERVAQKIVRGWTRVRWGGGSLHCRAGSRRWSWALVHPWPCRQAPLQRPCPHHRLGGALQIWALYMLARLSGSFQFHSLKAVSLAFLCCRACLCAQHMTCSSSQVAIWQHLPQLLESLMWFESEASTERGQPTSMQKGVFVSAGFKQ